MVAAIKTDTAEILKNQSGSDGGGGLLGFGLLDGQIISQVKRFVSFLINASIVAGILWGLWLMLGPGFVSKFLSWAISAINGLFRDDTPRQ